MKNEKNAFTLIELLAIIVILAIIAVITIPILLNVIDNARKGAAIDSALGYKDAVNKYYLSEMMNDRNFRIDGTYTINENGEMVKGSSTLSIPVNGQKPVGGEITYELQNIKEGCLTINGYKVIFNGNEVESASKGICYEQTNITFDLNYNNQTEIQQKNIDKKIGTLPTPARTNYALQGWFTEATGGTQINSDTMVAGATTYYAHWVQNAVSVTFDARGGSAVNPETTTVAMNHSYNQDHTQLPTTTREGYTFLGWFETQEGGNAITGNETLTTDKTYYAQWEEQAQSLSTLTMDEMCPGCKFIYEQSAQYAIEGSDAGNSGDYTTIMPTADDGLTDDYRMIQKIIGEIWIADDGHEYDDEEECFWENDESACELSLITEQRQVFLGLIEDEEDSTKIGRAFACGIEKDSNNNDVPFCLEGHDASKWSDNVGIINTVFPSCSDFDEYSASCIGSSLNINADEFGEVYVVEYEGYDGVYVSTDGSVRES